MRKIFALAMVALLAMTVALAAVGCAPKEEATPPVETPPVEAPMDTGMMMPDTSITDTLMSH